MTVLVHVHGRASACAGFGHVADGRVWGGLHWRFATDAGTDLGRAVARSVLCAEG